MLNTRFLSKILFSGWVDLQFRSENCRALTQTWQSQHLPLPSGPLECSLRLSAVPLLHPLAPQPPTSRVLSAPLPQPPLGLIDSAALLHKNKLVKNMSGTKEPTHAEYLHYSKWDFD